MTIYKTNKNKNRYSDNNTNNTRLYIIILMKLHNSASAWNNIPVVYKTNETTLISNKIS